MARAKKKPPKNDNGATVGYEAQLWQMADTLRGSMDAAEYKHVVLGLIFLKYISDAFEEQHARLVAERSQGADPEDPDEYRALNIFWVPPEARWAHLKAQAKQPTIGRLVDDAMAALERDNPSLKGVLPKDYARPALDKTRLGRLFYSTQIPACLWFLARERKNGKFRDRRGELLFIDARKLGRMVDRTHRELTDDDIQRIAGTYHAWRGPVGAGLVPTQNVGAGLVPARTVEATANKAPTRSAPTYSDIPGFCKSATLEEIRKHGHVLTPGRYVGAEAVEDDGEPFDEKMQRLTAMLRDQQAEALNLDTAIIANLKELGYGG